MAHKASTSWDTKPHKPIFYGPLARLSDRMAGRKDGRAGLPPLPTTPVAEPHHPRAVTPYLEIRNRHFLDRAERERRHMLTDLADTNQALTAMRQQIAGAQERIDEVRKVLDGIPEVAPVEQLTSRNAVEQHAEEALVRARRQREHNARRDQVVAEEKQAVAAARALEVQEAQLEGAIAARERILESRVRQLHEHTRRRCGTYKRRLAHHHPDREAIIPYLDLALPALPGWLTSHPTPLAMQ